MKPGKYLWFVFKSYLEVFIWVGALVWLATSSSDFSGHSSVCPLRGLGWSFCPGCGLGRSIILLFKGDLSGSFAMHPFGIPAVGILFWRIVTLVRKNRQILRSLNQTNSTNHDAPSV